MLRLPATLAELTPVTLRRLGQLALALTAVTLVACGGGNRAKDYQPDRIVVLGDENSALTSYTLANGGYEVKGLVYTINPVSLVSTTSAICADTTQTIGSLCVAADELTNVTKFTPSNPLDSTNPLGVGYHFGAADENVNLVTMMGLGSAEYGDPTSIEPQAKRSLGLFYACNLTANWVQTVAHAFHLGFRDDPEGCGLDYAGGRNFAVEGATIDTLQAQINSAQAAGLLGKGALVTVWVGQNDLYALLDNTAYDDTAKVYQAKLLADRLAGLIKPVIDGGAKVVVVGVAELAYSPYAVSKQGTGCADEVRTDNSAAPACNGVMQDMVTAFNKTLKIGDRDLGLKGLQAYADQGRDYAFIDAQGLVRSLALSPSYVNTGVFCESDTSKAAAMTNPDGQKDASSVKFCTTSTYTDGASQATYIWATDKYLGTSAHGVIGSSAANHAANQF